MRLARVRVILLPLCLAACGGGSSGGSQEDQFGTMTLRITDSPITEATAVVVEFTGVEIKAAEESAPEVFDFSTPRQINLLALSGGGSEILLEEKTLPAGHYEWIRLKVNAGLDASDSYIELNDGSQHALFIPSGNETGLKLVSGFTVGAGGAVDYTIDFELRKSVIRPPGLGGPFLLKPALRLVDNLEVGTIAGMVAASIAAETCSPAVYVYSDPDRTPDDLGSAMAPLVTGEVALHDASGEFRYSIGFVPAGVYTVALTCAAADDDPDADDELAFVGSQNATVTAGQTTTVDFAGE